MAGDAGLVTPRALILTGYGINCDIETGRAFMLAGAVAERVHLNDLIAAPERLHSFQILAVPGGFSFGDDVASGRILANRLRFKLGSELERFVEDGKLTIGICNGFQVLVKMGLLPLIEGVREQTVTLTHNDTGRFENRWVTLRTGDSTPCVWLKDMERIDLPIRHGEGKFVVRDGTVLEDLQRRGLVALRYVTTDGEPAGGKFPHNPNGSVDDIAGICDPSGRIFGLMPHPEAFLDGTNHPLWTRRKLGEEGAGLQLFKNAVAFAASMGS